MRIPNDCWLLTRPIAHRGLWNAETPENSLAAYEKAAQKNMPVEIDLFLTADGVPVIFHDDNLLRMTGRNRLIYETPFSELRKLRLSGTSETVPTLEEVLELARGRSPLLIEIKNQPDRNVAEKTVERMKKYDGEFAVQSFNPFYINKVRKLAPEFIRGILGAQEKERGVSLVKRLTVKYMPFNFLAKPDFISYRHTGLPLPERKTRVKALIAWCVTDKKEYEKIKPYVNNIIFEKIDAEKLK